MGWVSKYPVVRTFWTFCTAELGPRPRGPAGLFRLSELQYPSYFDVVSDEIVHICTFFNKGKTTNSHLVAYNITAKVKKATAPTPIAVGTNDGRYPLERGVDGVACWGE